MDNDTYDEIMRRLERVELDFANLQKVQRDVLFQVQAAHLDDLRDNRLIVARLERHIKNLEKSKRGGAWRSLGNYHAAMSSNVARQREFKRK